MGIFKTKDKERLDETDQHLVDQYTSCFNGPSGDFVIGDLYVLTGFPLSLFDQPDVEYDPIKAAHRDGMQTVLKRILNLSGKMEKVFK
jgi:hypothetical protein